MDHHKEQYYDDLINVKKYLDELSFAVGFFSIVSLRYSYGQPPK